MGFIKYIPYGKHTPLDVITTTEREVQLWQEFTMLRHCKTNVIYGKLVNAPYIDQAKTYYHDAKRCDWKSAGLLYYYSFLNLAKAYIISKRALSGKYMKSTSIYHGLYANPQNPRRIIDFNINIHPPTSNNKKNIFSIFYEKLTGENWPFNSTVTVRLADVVGHCSDILYELQNFYNTVPQGITLQSLIREMRNDVWFEVVVPNHSLSILHHFLGASIGITREFSQMDATDKHDWLIAHKRTANSLSNCTLVRLGQQRINQQNKEVQYIALYQTLENLFENHILPDPTYSSDNAGSWHFIPKISLNGIQINWHPLLSNYLFSFMLSTVLRYHPHIFSSDNPNSFIAEAWCNQSAISSLRYFLMEMTTNNIRVN